jgi:nicotinamidase-related amidase
VYVRHDGSPAELLPGTPEWNIGSEISPLEGEPVVDKRFGDAFQETNLSDVLAAIGADHLIVTGMQTDYCVRATIAGAADRGFRVTLVADAHATNPSNGKTEQQISEELYADWLARGVAIVSASDLARIGVSHT